MTHDELIERLVAAGYILAYDGDKQGRGAYDARSWWDKFAPIITHSVRVPSIHQDGYALFANGYSSPIYDTPDELWAAFTTFLLTGELDAE